MSQDPYHVLGLDRDASAAEIARAYRRAARATHPDSGAAGAASAERFRAVSEAYEALRGARRAELDRTQKVDDRSFQRQVRVEPPRAAHPAHDAQHIVLGGGDASARAFARLLRTFLRSGW